MKRKTRILAVLIIVLALSATLVLVALLTPTVSAIPRGNWNPGCIRSCNNGHASCLSGCSPDDYDCYMWCYYLWVWCTDVCSGGITWEPNYYC
jgi:hypothetical protein